MKPYTDDINGPWISHDKIPPLLRSFDMSRDPYIRAQTLDMEKTESQRRGEQDGRGSRMVANDHPVARFNPPPELRDSVDRRHFNKSWLAEQRNAAFAQARPKQFRDERSPSRHPVHHEPSR